MTNIGTIQYDALTWTAKAECGQLNLEIYWRKKIPNLVQI